MYVCMCVLCVLSAERCLVPVFFFCTYVDGYIERTISCEEHTHACLYRHVSLFFFFLGCWSVGTGIACLECIALLVRHFFFCFQDVCTYGKFFVVGFAAVSQCRCHYLVLGVDCCIPFPGLLAAFPVIAEVWFGDELKCENNDDKQQQQQHQTTTSTTTTTTQQQQQQCIRQYLYMMSTSGTWL